jgi:signal peptidase I
MTGDFLLVNKFIFGGTTPQTIPFTNVKLPAFKLPAFWDVERGDVIVFIFPGMRHEVEPADFAYYLKRCIAVAGDTMQIRNRVIYVNGQQFPVPRNMKYNSPFIRDSGDADPRIFPPGMPFNEDNYGPIRIPMQGDIIPLGVNNFSAWEIFIKREGHSAELLNGKVYVDGKETSSYAVERDYLFGMGDNRDNSLDSRFWGFIPVESIIGTPLIVYWSWNPDLPLITNQFPFVNIFEKISTVRWNRIATIVK